MGLHSDNTVISTMTLPAVPAESMEIVFKSETTERIAESFIDNVPFPLSASPVFHVPVNSLKFISRRNDKNIIELILNFKDVNYDYHPGDTLSVIPKNDSEEVESIADILGLREKLDNVCELSLINKPLEGKQKLSTKSIPTHLPAVSTLRHILEECVEIRGPPKKLFIRALAEYTTNLEEKNTLLELCSREGSKKYEKFCSTEGNTVGPGFGLLKFLQTFPSCVPPVTVILQHLPRLKARPYSIASSPLVSDKIRLIFSVYKEKECKGVCTGWLENLMTFQSLEEQFNSMNLNDAKVLIPSFLRKSVGFRLPEDPSTPIILIGPGTGIAPFLGFLEHRAAQMKADKSKEYGEVWLFYGCQNPEIDFIYEDSLKGYLKHNVLSELFLSFSRYSGSYDGWDGAKYVQDNIKKFGEKFVDQLLDKESVLYISGDAKNMFKDVMECISSTIQNHRGVGQDEASNIIKELVKKKRYLQDIWC
ncbi:hypothetical protein J437_LFUL009410 [Ladona fulva]|uniref:Methionine synthase reductase n=1 Tax=Ladona fulva TaxID=123851 RepID=A0A8K0P3I1_LADFU|nr:hypothetical protein J437_LFUL009410 [Ladona fulva]